LKEKKERIIEINKSFEFDEKYIKKKLKKMEKKKKMNKLFLISLKYTCQHKWEDDDYLYVIIAKNKEEAIKIGDIDIPSDYKFEILKETSLNKQIILEWRRCYACNRIQIYEIYKYLKKSLIKGIGDFYYKNNIEKLKNILINIID